MTTRQASEGRRPSVSACVITLDEEARLPACLASVGWCDEVVVVDSGSTDATVALARAAGARVIAHPWSGFAAQRNVALEAATGTWVLEIDADERLEPELVAGIERFLADPELTGRHDIAMLPMRHRFLGGLLWQAMQAPGYRPRLFRREAYRHDERRTVHEGLWPRGPAFPVDSGAMVHELAAGWQEAVCDARAYARLEARQFDGAVTFAGVARGMLARPAAKAAYRLCVDGGWRDGWQGAARIGLESGADAWTWAHLLRAGRRDGRATHFGSVDVHLGAPKVAAVATSRRRADEVTPWLEQAASAGAEAVLVAPSGLRTGPEVRLRKIAGRGPLAVTRALNAEHQLRPLDGLLVGDPRLEPAVRLSRAGHVPRMPATGTVSSALAVAAARRS